MPGPASLWLQQPGGPPASAWLGVREMIGGRRERGIIEKTKKGKCDCSLVDSARFFLATGKQNSKWENGEEKAQMGQNDMIL